MTLFVDFSVAYVSASLTDRGLVVLVRCRSCFDFVFATKYSSVNYQQRSETGSTAAWIGRVRHHAARTALSVT